MKLEDKKVESEEELHTVIEEGSHPLSDSFEGEFVVRNCPIPLFSD